MAFTLNRRLAQLIDSSGQLNTGKIPNDYITSDHVADNSITTAMLHTGFTLPTSSLTSIDTDNVTEGSSNLYYTDARVATYISGNRDYGNITTTGYIAGPATFTIDPAAVGDNTGTVVIAGNLQVDGTTTTINSTTLTVDDKLVTLASGSANAGAANGAGIEVDISGATNPSILYDGTNDEWDLNKNVRAESFSVGAGPTSELLFLSGAGHNGHGTTNTRSVAAFNQTGQSAGLWFGARSNETTAVIGTRTASGNLAFETYNSGWGERMRLTNDGKVGIGVTSPSSYTFGDVAISGGTSAGLTLVSGTTGIGTLAFADGTSGNTAYRGYVQYSHVTDNLTIGTGGTPVATIDSSGKLLIGDTASHVDDLLQIETPASGGGHGIQIRRNDSNGDQGIGRIMFGNNNDTDLATISSVTDGQADCARLVFSTQPNGGSSTERMRIDSSGNVQIGTSNPSGNKGITIQAGTDSSASLRLKNDAHDWDVNCQTNDKFAIYSHTAGTERLVIDTSGNVGIGTTSPAFENGNGLEIRNAGGNGAHLKLTDAASGTGGTQGFDLYMFNSQGYIENYENAPTIFRNNGSETMRINAAGGLSINDNIENPLSLNRTTTTTGASYITFTNAGGNYYIGADSSAGNRIAIGGLAYGFTMTAESGRPLVFATSNTARMTVDSSGNVGIGNINPGVTLDISTSTANTNGVVRIQNNMDNNYEALRLHSLGNFDAQMSFLAQGDSTYWGAFGIDYSDAGKFKLQTDNLFDAGSNLMTWARDGSVGIGGETSPDDTLHVNKAGGTARIRIGSGNDAYYTQRGYLGDTWVFGTSETGDNVDFKISGGAFTTANTGGNFRFFTQMSNGTPTERMHISSEGYLEINSFSAQPDDTNTSTHRKIEFKANGAGTQTHKRDCFVQNNAGSVQYHWYKITLGSNVYGRGSNVKYTANWSTGHASGQGFMDGSFICRARHDNSRITVHGHIVYSRQVITGSYYAWSHDPDITLYESTASGSSAGLYMRVQGSRTSGYDGAAVHALYLEIFGSRQDTHYQGIQQVGTSTPSDVGSAISRTILS